MLLPIDESGTANSEEVPSPCTKVCRLDTEQVCEGCGRTLTEIAAWSGMTSAEKCAVLLRLRRIDTTQKAEAL